MLVRFKGKDPRRGQVAELDEVTAERLIAQGAAAKVPAGSVSEPGTPSTRKRMAAAVSTKDAGDAPSNKGAKSAATKGAQ